MFPTHLLYDAAGRPDVGAEAVGAHCAVCGQESNATRPVPFSEKFTDWDKLRHPASGRVCAACAFAFAEQIPMPGRDRPQRMRNYSHFVVGGRWLCLHKGQKAEMQAVLLNPPAGHWLAVVGESGQKHIIFRARVNAAPEPCHVQFEETGIVTSPAELGALLGAVEQLYAGFTKGEIETGQYEQHRILRFGFAAWRALEQQVVPQRGAALLRLALFLAQKDDDNDNTGANGGGTGAYPASGRELGQMGEQAAQILEHIPGSGGGQRVHQPAGGVHQLDLFADGH
jgi:CRISPR type IV-associated protein Csf1